MRRLPAEWEPHEAVLLTWPHEGTDWAPILSETERFYSSLTRVLLTYVDVIIAVAPAQHERIAAALQKNCASMPHSFYTYAVLSNDTWSRDHGPISVKEINEKHSSKDGATQSESIRILDFTFNAWGNKYESELDNVLTQKLMQAGAFSNHSYSTVNFVLEGGAIDSNGDGTLLTTEQCLLNTNRNGPISKTDVERVLREQLGVQRVLWLKNGYLAGDDTDSHIDTLARFAPNNIITYVSCDDPDDEHYEALSLMEKELKQFTDANGKPFRLINLPLPSAIYDDAGSRLPATYANHLVTNHAVLVPVYDDPKDELALKQVTCAFPDRKVVGVNCRTLIKQHGSLHCITMQIPRLTRASPF